VQDAIIRTAKSASVPGFAAPVSHRPSVKQERSGKKSEDL
jgi:hypothetical protein